jgi:uncharacterized cupredoxin-like copper-binding protein
MWSPPDAVRTRHAHAGVMTSTLLDPEVQPDEDTASTEAALSELRHEVQRQGKSMRSTQQAFSIFALLALLLAGATLLAVVFKLDNTKSNSVNISAPVTNAVSQAAPAPALPHRIGVGLREFAVDTTASTAAAGRVTFNVRNTGKVTHEFVVLRTAKPAGALLNGARADESGNVGETGDLKAGASKKLTLSLKPGHYALICNLPGHYRAGQHTDFTVR